MLDTVLPLSNEVTRSLFVQTQSEWTAYFDNNNAGPEARREVSVLARKIGCQGVHAEYVPNTLTGTYRKPGGDQKGRYGSTMFAMYADRQIEIHNTLRYVYAANDGGRWAFGADGEIQPFEEIEAYTAKKKQDRFTPQMLDRYLRALGIRAFDEDFYETPEGCYLVDNLGPFESYVGFATLAEVRARFV